MNNLVYVYYATLAISIVAGSLCWKKLHLSGRIILITTALLACNEIARKAAGMLNSPLLRLAVMTLTTGLTAAFIFTPRDTPYRFSAMTWLAISGCAFLVIKNAASLSTDRLPADFYLYEAVFFSILAIWNLYGMAVCTKLVRLYADPHFLIWGLILVYNCGTLAFWGSLQFLNKERADYLSLSMAIHDLLNILFYAGLAFAFSRFTPAQTKSIGQA